MVQIEVKPGGNELAKVLHYFGLLAGEQEFKIICPFHEDINPSMKIDLSTGTFKCFGCEKSGDALKFVEYMGAQKGYDSLESCKKYFKILKSKKTKHIKSKHYIKKVVDNQQALIEAEDYYFGLKSTDWRKEEGPEKDYMLNRGFTIKALRYCKAKINYNISYPIIFPMFDLNEFKGWVCRTTHKRIEEKRKYLYNEGFSRRNTLVGDYDSEVVMLVEGYMDRLKMIQFGVKKVAAILGWKITEHQIAKLKKQGVKYIISALDTDECGCKGTEYLKRFFKVIRFQFPEGIKDPGDMTEKQFKVANTKTKKLYREALQNGINRRHQKSSEKARSKQR